MKAIKQTLLALALAGAFTNANAIPVDWTLELTQTGYSFEKTYGTFTYDADTNTYSNVAFKLTFSSATFGINSGDANSFSYGISNITGIYTLTFDTALSNAGGTVTGTGSNKVGGVPTYWSFSIHAASTATAVPEPEAYAMMLAGLGLVGFAARRKLS